jgi:hypothetical protein
LDKIQDYNRKLKQNVKRMPRNWLLRLQAEKTTPQKAKGAKEDHWRNFWMCETGSGQQVAQLLDTHMLVVII